MRMYTKTNAKKSLLFRGISAFLTLVFLLGFCPLAVFEVSADTFSYNLSSTLNGQFVLEYSGDGLTKDNDTLTWKVPGSFITPNTYKLYFENKCGYESILTYTLSFSQGEIKDNINQSLKSGQTYTNVLQNGGQITLSYTGKRIGIASATVSNISLVPVSKSISATSSDIAMGVATVSASSAQLGTTVTFSATPNDSFRFVKWINTEGITVSTAATYSAIVESDLALTAIFEEMSNVRIHVGILQEKCGTVSMDGVAYGTFSTFVTDPFSTGKVLYAEPKTGYIFAGWINELVDIYDEQSVIYSTAQELPLAIEEIHQYWTAVFLKVNRFSAISSDETRGTVAIDRENGVIYETVTFSASPKNGYVFDGWYDEDGDLYSASQRYAHKITEEKDLALIARFRPIVNGDAICALVTDATEGSPLGTAYSDLQEGLNAASVSGGAVVLTQKVTLSYNLYIPKGVTLIVPWSADDRGKEKTKEDTSASITTAHTSSLVVPQNFSIEVDGTLIVNAVQGTRQPQSGNIVGTYGLLELEGLLLVKDGGVLKARGIITGANGRVETESGSTIYQLFEIGDWRGGSDSYAIYKYVFPINLFYIQNIQVDTEYVAGAVLNVYYLVNMSTGPVKGVLTLIDTSAVALFRMSAGSKLVFHYEATRDNKVIAKTIVDSYGNVYAQSTSIKVDMDYFVVEMSTATLQCPISAAFDINVMDGSVFQLDRSFRILPGAAITIHEGGKIIVAETGNLYLYDVVDFEAASSGGFSYGGYRRLPQSSGKANINVNYAETEDAKLIVNGTLEIYGGFYCSSGSDSDGDGFADNTADDIYSSSVITTASTGKIIIASTARLSDTHIQEYDYASAKNDNSEGRVNSHFTGARGVFVDNSEEYQKFAVNTTYYSNGSAWYTYAVQYQNSDETPIEDGTFYFVNNTNTDHVAPAVNTIPTRDGTYIYESRIWGSASEGKLANGCAATIYTPGQAMPVGLDSDLQIEYRIHDYIWLNAIVTAPAEGSQVQIVDANGQVNEDFFLVPLNNGQYYIVKKVFANELTTEMVVYLQIDGLRTEALYVGFPELAKLDNGEHEQLVEEMLVYGRAADTYFDGVAWEGEYLSPPTNEDGTLIWSGYGRATATHVASGALEGITVRTSGVNGYFDNRIGFTVWFALKKGNDYVSSNLLEELEAIYGTGSIAQIGLLVGDKNYSDALKTDSGMYSKAYILYNSENALAVPDANKPDFGLAVGDVQNSMTLNEIKSLMVNSFNPDTNKESGCGLSFDIKTSEYMDILKLRLFVVLDKGDGTHEVLYGSQYEYSLPMYLNATYANSTPEYQNFVCATWNYITAAKEAFPE